MDKVHSWTPGYSPESVREIDFGHVICPRDGESIADTSALTNKSSLVRVAAPVPSLASVVQVSKCFSVSRHLDPASSFKHLLAKLGLVGAATER